MFNGNYKLFILLSTCYYFDWGRGSNSFEYYISYNILFTDLIKKIKYMILVY